MNADGDCEIGAWIIANSWGDGWENNGFIYCPYEKSNCVKGWPKENSFTPGYYEVLRNYRPLRTIKVKMEYSRRSEIALHVGVAQNVNATKPEKEMCRYVYVFFSFLVSQKNSLVKVYLFKPNLNVGITEG